MKWKSIILIAGGMAVASLLIGFTGSDRRMCRQVLVTIDNQLDNHFVDRHDIMSILTAGFTRPVEGVPFNEIGVRELERRLLQNPYIREAEIYRDLRGHLLVHTVLRRPVARLVQPDGPDAYVAGDGTVLPVSEKFSARVPVITGTVVNEIAAAETMAAARQEALFELIKFIQHDKFWQAQIAQIEVLDNGEIILWPQVTRQYIEFGKPENLTDKFRRLRVFYTDILPRKGWNTYKKVNVKYRKQIVCE